MLHVQYINMEKIIDTLIVSDIHIGSEVSRVRELTKVLKHLSLKRLVLDGDIFDNENPKRLKKDDWEFLSFLQTLVNKNVEVVWVQGNHDGFARNFFQMIGVKICREFQFIFDGKKCVVIHGHQYDRFLIRNRVISKTMNVSYRVLQKIDRGKRRTSRFMKKQYKFWLRLSPRVMKGAVKHAIDRKAQVVICGHTHQYMDKTARGVRYINIGSWTDSPSSFLALGKNGIGLEIFR